MHHLFWHVKEKIAAKVFRLQKKKYSKFQSFSFRKEKLVQPKLDIAFCSEEAAKL